MYFFIILQHWYDASYWNPFLQKTYVSCVVNTTVADALVMQGTRSLAAIVLT